MRPDRPCWTTDDLNAAGLLLELRPLGLASAACAPARGPQSGWTPVTTGFGDVGSEYGAQLARGLRLTGEPAEHFARRRVARVRALTGELGVATRGILDFGCGTGGSLGILREAFPDAAIFGFEPEASLAAVARSEAEAARAVLLTGKDLTEIGIVDVVYCNGVFHHIPPDERARATSGLTRALRGGGLACIWENSPFNPFTRLIMARIPFDRDAVLLTPGELRMLQRGAGLVPVRTEYHFVFPHLLRFARGVETALRSLPLGGQYVVVGRKETHA